MQGNFYGILAPAILAQANSRLIEFLELVENFSRAALVMLESLHNAAKR
jgi:hypothetical protein